MIRNSIYREAVNIHIVRILKDIKQDKMKFEMVRRKLR